MPSDYPESSIEDEDNYPSWVDAKDVSWVPKGDRKRSLMTVSWERTEDNIKAMTLVNK